MLISKATLTWRLILPFGFCLLPLIVLWFACGHITSWGDPEGNSIVILAGSLALILIGIPASLGPMVHFQSMSRGRFIALATILLLPPLFAMLIPCVLLNPAEAYAVLFRHSDRTGFVAGISLSVIVALISSMLLYPTRSLDERYRRGNAIVLLAVASIIVLGLLVKSYYNSLP